jgi:PTS system mannose-specific IID component
MTAAPPVPGAFSLPLRTRVAMFLRMLAIQGAWNYETLLGNGIGFSVEPALRRLPGGPGGAAYRQALARQSQYFNAHPYMAAVAVGALARAELDGEAPERIERFRTAMCGPLGSVGDRLVWASWLPACSLVALAAFGLGATPAGAALLFLGLYNVGHLGLRIWGLRAGYTHGLRVASALAAPVLRQGPQYLARAGALIGGFALPVVLDRLLGPGRTVLGVVLVLVALGGVLFARLQGRVEGWKAVLGLLALFVLYAAVR